MTWDQITEKFLLKYFASAKTTKLRSDISLLAQIELEIVPSSWVTFVVTSLNLLQRQIIDVAASGTLNNKTPEVAQEFIKEMALNNYKWQVMRTKLIKATGVLNMDVVVMLTTLSKKIDGLSCSKHGNSVMQCNAMRLERG
ncbi:pentatricopeptide repeat-containing protein chloroplastic-like [Gossypium australe]|uniref:Pentatricopeptide repeat-containing protein chloroplastic-like n=1 Tax=Gossypium australe TaxID=47621 RepID=A0A5B6VZ43_9ROSI|nr:pentatricopeptide repeat-containing protein chloroplastic-like [Gossypium australe]